MNSGSQNSPPHGDILIVDDNLSNLKFLTDILTQAGYRVRPAGDGELALRSVQVKQPDLILLDIKMPGLSGIEVCRRLKANPETMNLPVIFLSALDETDMKVKAFEAGAIDYVTKPIEPTEVLARINTYINMYRLQQRLEVKSQELIEEIEERRATEVALKESEEKYRALYDNAPLSYQSLNENGCFIDINPKWLRTLGFEREEVIGKWFGDFLHPDSKPHFEKNFPVFKKHGYVHDVEFKIKHKDGHYLDISFEGCIGYTPEGKFKQTYCVFQDITERKQAEDALRIERDNLKNIFESMDDGVYIVNQQYDVQYVNPVLMKDFGAYEARKCYEYFHDRTEVCPWCKAIDVFAGKTVRWEWHSLKNHRDYDLIDSPLLNPDGTISKLEIFRDITEIKQFQHRLEQSEKRYKEAQSLARLGHWDYNPCKDSLFWSDELYSIFEIDKDAEPLSFAEFIKRIHSEDRDSIREQAEKGESFRSDYRIVMADGSVKYIHEEVLVIHQEDGKIVQMKGTAQDITERKQMEKAFLQSENKFRLMMESMSDPVYICSDDYLVEYMNPAMIKRIGREATGEFCYQALHDFDQPCPWCNNKKESHGKYFESDIVSPKDKHSYHISHSPIINQDGSISNMIIFRDTTEFKKMEAQLLQAQKMESIGNLAGGIAHDFNNILTSIYGYSEMVLDELEEGSETWQNVQEILKSGEQAANLTRQLLAFSRSQKILPRVVNINSLLDEMEKMLGRLIGEDIRLETSLDDQVGKIYADPGQLNQIVVNLVVNARDALRSHLEVADKIINVSTSEVYLDKDYAFLHEGSSSGRHLLLEFSDNGCGMRKEVLGHIFEPFYTTKAAGKGTGMGLATVYGIVKQNNGSIYVYSEPGLGTTFKIYWPIMNENEGVDNEADVKPEFSIGGTEVILLAEDDEKIREIVSRKLRQKGYQVIAAPDGLKALEKAKNHKGTIDLLFTDVVMPLMGGKELSDKIKELYPDIAILFVSGYLDDSIHKDILSKGHFINKPYSFKDIFNRIRQLLDK